MIPRGMRPLLVVVMTPDPADGVQMPLSDDYELVETFEL